MFCRFDFGAWILIGWLVGLDLPSNLEAQDATGGYVLPDRSSDRELVQFDSATAARQLAVPRGQTVAQLRESVRVSGVGRGQRESFAVQAGSPPWDLSDYLYLAVDVRNTSAGPLTLVCRAEDPEYAGWHHYSESVSRVAAGEATTVLVFLKRKTPASEEITRRFPGMDTLPNGYMPHWSGLNPARISKLVFGLEGTNRQWGLELRRIRAIGPCPATPLLAADYFPFIDAFGQFRHADWPTKIQAPADFARQRAAESAAIQASPHPVTWDKYGGYAVGPQLAATGNFRVEKYAGKWWLVDPDGRLFWSHGVTGVGIHSETPLRGRRNFFTQIPEAGKTEHGVMNWYQANLQIKYGPDADDEIGRLAHQRLANWGLNTMACWSDPAVTGRDKTPYTKMLNIGGPRLAPSLRLADPYDPAFEQSAREAFAAEKSTTYLDPWCIGYFIGNELEWQGGPSVINEVLTAAADRPGKQALVHCLQQRHGSIADLNAAWHATYASWADLLARTNKVDATRAANDFAAFNEELARRYYETVQTERDHATPGKLNLGSRFNTINPVTVRIAAQYCDVVSFNKYETSIRNLALPDHLDRPIIIGEFHFPAWDRSFAANAGCGPLAEAQRADGYWYYVTGALENPLIVGTHWFQYLDQPLTGRSDGENFAIGFVDVTDTPYAALTRVTRDLGETLYSHRLQGGSSPAPRQPLNQAKHQQKNPDHS